MDPAFKSITPCYMSAPAGARLHNHSPSMAVVFLSVFSHQVLQERSSGAWNYSDTLLMHSPIATLVFWVLFCTHTQRSSESYFQTVPEPSTSTNIFSLFPGRRPCSTAIYSLPQGSQKWPRFTMWASPCFLNQMNHANVISVSILHNIKKEMYIYTMEI